MQEELRLKTRITIKTVLSICKSFTKALENDSGLAMAEWGMALTLGENINDAETQTDLSKAYDKPLFWYEPLRT